MRTMLCRGLLWCLLTWSFPSSDAKSTCDTSDTQRGDNGSLTCHFDKNLRQNYTAFAVHRYNLTGALINPAHVLDCFWKSTEDLKCTADDGYSFNETVTNKITVEIHEASDKHVGRYACLEVPPVPGEFFYCTFQPKEPPQVSSTQSADVSTAEGGTDCASRQKCTLWIISIILWLARLQ